ncbi:MAG: hypothetical protein PHV82_16295 [Victivallaceae bacterium]|nr:hypothetical protein [Victivallaceae bacterium]
MGDIPDNVWNIRNPLKNSFADREITENNCPDNVWKIRIFDVGVGGMECADVAGIPAFLVSLRSTAVGG